MYTVYTRIACLFVAVALLAACDSGTVPDDVGSSTTLSFASSSVNVAEDDGDVTLEVVVNDPGFKDPIEFTVTRSGGSADDADIMLPSENTFTFPQSVTGGETRTYTIDLVDDLFPEGSETLSFDLAISSGDASLGENSSATVSIEASEQDVSTMPEARALAEDDSVAVTGIVTRLDGSTIYFEDENAGMGAFEGAVADQVEPGTELLLDGVITEFRGLLQVSIEDDNFEIGREGLPLPEGVEATLDQIQTNGEIYESRVVRVSGLSVVSPQTETWEDFTEYELTDGTNTIAMFISGDSPVAGETIPDEFTYNGIVDQRDVYQFLSLREGDIQ